MLSEHRVDLGETTLTLEKANLQVSVRCTADLTSPNLQPANPNLSDQSVPNHQDVWVSKSHDFSCSFRLSFDNALQLLPQHRDTILNHVGHALEAAELWTQLGLTPNCTFTAPESSPHSPSNHTLFLELHHSHENGNTNLKSLYDTASVLREVTNVKPPNFVPTFLLSRVQISLLFLPTPLPIQQKGQKRQGSNLFQDRIVSGTKAEPVYAGADFLLGSENQQIIFDESENSFPTNYDSMRDGQNHTRLQEWSESQDHDLFEDIVGRFQVHNAPFPLADAKAVLSLIDAAFRNYICYKPIRISAGIKGQQYSQSLRLAELAPAVFCPGYAQKVADRAPLIPKIAKFLSSFVRHSNSADILRDASQPTSQLNPHEKAAEDANTNPEEVFLKDLLKSHLWVTMTNNSRSPEPARRLKPLITSNIPDNEAYYFDESFRDLNSFVGYNEHEDATLEEKLQVMLLDDQVSEYSEVIEDPFLFDLYEDSLEKSLPSTNEDADRPLELDDSLPVSYRNHEIEMNECHPEATLPQHCSHRSVYLAKMHVNLEEGKSLIGAMPTPDQLWCLISSKQPNHDYNGALNEGVQRLLPNTVIGENHRLSESSIRSYPVCRLNTHGDRHESASTLIGDDERDELDTEFQNHSLFPCHQQHISTPGLETALGETNLFDDFITDTDMLEETRSNRSSLTDVLGGDFLLRQMWKRRPSVEHGDEDILEMQAIYQNDPDMRGFAKTRHSVSPDTVTDEEMIEENILTNAFESPTMSPSSENRTLSYPMRQNTERIPERQSRPDPSSPASSPRRTSRSSTFFRGFSFGNPLSRRSSVDLQADDLLLNTRQREMDVRRRKTLDDYHIREDGDELLMF